MSHFSFYSITPTHEIPVIYIRYPSLISKGISGSTPSQGYLQHRISEVHIVSYHLTEDA